MAGRHTVILRLTYLKLKLGLSLAKKYNTFNHCIEYNTWNEILRIQRIESYQYDTMHNIQHIEYNAENAKQRKCCIEYNT